MRQGGQKPACRYGPNCKRNATGQCNFFHPPQDNQGRGNPNMNGGGGGNRNNNWDKPNSFIHHQSGQSNFQNGGQTQPSGNYRGGNNYQGGQGNYQNNTYQNNPQGQQGGFKQKNNDIFFQLCKNFHLAQQCTYGDDCKKKHYFILNDQDAIRRFNFLRDAPNHLISKLTKFRSGNKDFFALRAGNTITFFDFNIETKALNHVFTWNLPQLANSSQKYNYYDHKGQYIYYSFSNAQMLLQDIGIFHISTQTTILIQNSNTTRVTGIAHFNENILLTTSVGGDLKVWTKEGEKYLTHLQSNEKLRNYYNPTNQKIQLLFLDVSEVNGIKIISAGTNDGRVLFFIGNDLAFNQVLLKDQAYANVYGIKYTKKQGIPTAIVLAWNSQKTISTLLQINLTNFQKNVIIQNIGTQDQNKTNISIFQFVEDYLMVGNLFGNLSIYRYPNTTEKIGGIYHQNQISDIVYSEHQLINTGIKVKFMIILQKKTQQREGSLGFYLLK